MVLEHYKTELELAQYVSKLEAQVKGYKALCERMQAQADEMRSGRPVVPDELLQIGELIRTQDNRCTDRPIFCVMKKRAIVVNEDYDHDRIEWVDTENDYVLASEHKSRRLEALYEHGRETGSWQRFAMKDVDEFVTACFTEQGCKDFIARDGHNHRKPFIYAYGSNRNSEFRAIRDYLAGLPASPTTSGGGHD